MAIPDFEPERELALFGVFDGHGGAAVPRAAFLTRLGTLYKGFLARWPKLLLNASPKL